MGQSELQTELATVTRFLSERVTDRPWSDLGVWQFLKNKCYVKEARRHLLPTATSELLGENWSFGEAASWPCRPYGGGQWSGQQT